MSPRNVSIGIGLAVLAAGMLRPVPNDAPELPNPKAPEPSTEDISREERAAAKRARKAAKRQRDYERSASPK